MESWTVNSFIIFIHITIMPVHGITYLLLLFFLLIQLFVPHGSVVMMRLTEESLTRPPEEVFDVLEKLGEG